MYCAGPWFSVEGKNEERNVQGVSYLKKLYVTVNGITVTMMKSRVTLVSMAPSHIHPNGTRASASSLPLLSFFAPNPVV